MLAWSEPKEPSCPVFIAVSKVAASGPRTSPTIIRSGRIRRLDFRQSFMSTSGVPSGRSRRVSIRSQWSWYTCNSAVSSTVSNRRCHGMYIPRQLSVVVLPDPVPPAITKLAGRLSSPSIQTHIIAASLELTVPNFTKSIIVRGSSLNLRMVSVGPSGVTGGIVPFTREPSGRRPSKIGTSPGPSPRGTLVKAAIFLAI